MKITITGDLGSGKSTVAKLIADELGYKHYSSGDFMRELATEKGVSLMGLSKTAETDKSVDTAIDDRQVKIGKEEDNFVIDARLAFHFIPDSKKIYIKVDEKVAAKRIFKAKRDTEPENTSEESTVEKMRARKASEIKRYNEYYGIDYTDMSQFDLVIDSSNITAEEVKDKILEFLKQ